MGKVDFFPRKKIIQNRRKLNTRLLRVLVLFVNTCKRVVYLSYPQKKGRLLLLSKNVYIQVVNTSCFEKIGISFDKKPVFHENLYINQILK